MDSPSKPFRGRLRHPYAIIAAVALALVIVFIPIGVIRIGQWLVVEDPLQPSSAIVVLSGHLPFRAMEAARIYQQGLAPEVWLTRGTKRVEEAALEQLGIHQIGEEIYNLEVLKRMGVPEAAVHVLDDPILNTRDEVLLVAQQLRRTGGSRVIIVTSKSNSRRAKAIWRSLVGTTPQAIVRYTDEDRYDPSHWWRNTSDVQAVLHETLGLMNVWIGFRVHPDRLNCH